MEAELLADEKECAEHVMLVDLGRNDVGKVSVSGSIEIEALMQVWGKCGLSGAGSLPAQLLPSPVLPP